jgi:sensor c-di-GMP phosphodiesterase-like protein
MKHTLKQRALITLAATAMAALIGMLAGDLTGRVLTLKAAKAKLLRDVTYFVAQGDAFSDESRAMLATLNASPYPYCSETEIAYFRKLLFQAKYLRDAGRMRNGTIECSATMSRADLPLQQFKPDRSQPDGTLVFSSLPPFRVGNSQGFLLQQGESYVVYAPHLLETQSATSSHIVYTPTTPSLSQNGKIGSGMSQADAKIFTTNGQARLGDSLFVTRCSAHYFRCASTYISITEAMAGDHVHRTLSAALGCFIGALAGLFSSLLYRRNRSMEHQLRRAIARDKVRLVYQPIVDLATRRIIGAEALARWTDEEGFAVAPDVFVRVAEDFGFVGELTRLVVRHALRDFAQMIRDNPEFRLSINVAAADLSDPKFLPMLGESLKLAGVPAKNLAIEITESSTARHQMAREAILRLRQSGHSVHVDDFGTGYSSLSYLHDLSIDTIKIDRSFTQVIGTQAVTVGILPQILAMAAVLHLDVIVEGVETSQQASYFANADKSIRAQGWFFGRPMPVDAFQNLLSEGKEETEHPFTVASEPAPCHAVFFESSHNPLKISSSSPI